MQTSPSLRSNDDHTVVPADRGLLNASSVEILSEDPPFSHGFLDRDPESSKARSLYFKIVGGTVLLVLTYVIWGVLPIYWASVFDLYGHVHHLNGWVVDLDGGVMGQTVSQAFIGSSGPATQITWMAAPSTINLTTREQFEYALVDEKTWAIVTINQGATDHLNQVLSSGNGPYNGTSAVTIYINEARSSNAVRSFVLPQTQTLMTKVEAMFAIQQAAELGSSGSLNASLLTNAPLAVVNPLAHTLDNAKPLTVGLVSLLSISSASFT